MMAGNTHKAVTTFYETYSMGHGQYIYKSVYVVVFVEVAGSPAHNTLQ